MKKLFLIVLTLGLLASCESKKKEIKDQETVKKPVLTELQTKAKGIFGELPLVADNKENPVTEEKVALGKALYFDTILSKNKTQSCNTCHNLDTYGVDNLPVSPGDKKGTFGGRNSPTTLNAALHISQFWDGREPDVEAQSGGPVLNPVEMGMSSEKEVEERLSEVEKYQKMFAKAFPADKEAISYNNMKKAIGAFERKLLTPSKFDDYLAGDDNSMNKLEKEGLVLFMDKGCIACHAGNALGGNIYQKFGIYADYWTLTKSEKIDKGRFDVTKNEADMYVFKSQSLRNIAKTYPYFHDGSVGELEEAVKIMGKIQLNIDFTESEVKALVAYLNTLTGEIPVELKS
ncbi:MAG TPA: cytochrome-c peroxidase [Lutibacter sp.]|nr:cytochrome-c peroxidase [Lutibacter sp.]